MKTVILGPVERRPDHGGVWVTDLDMCIEEINMTEVVDKEREVLYLSADGKVMVYNVPVSKEIYPQCKRRYWLTIVEIED